MRIGYYKYIIKSFLINSYRNYRLRKDNIIGRNCQINKTSQLKGSVKIREAAIIGQVDYLYGLKENIIIGKLIPAGTGVASFKLKYLGENVSELEKKARDEETTEIELDKISLDKCLEV